jgi:hypothetical protein
MAKIILRPGNFLFFGPHQKRTGKLLEQREGARRHLGKKFAKCCQLPGKRGKEALQAEK